MANRYLVATGNWNSTSVWSATSGGAGGASVPVSGDNVYLLTSHTVTLNANAACTRIYHQSGGLNLNGYTLSGNYDGQSPNGNRTLSLGSGTLRCTVQFVVSKGSYTTSLNLGSGTIEFSSYTASFQIGSSGSGTLTVSAGSSLIRINTHPASATVAFDTGGYVYNDVQIDLSSSSGATVNMTGSPTFRSLIIQSKNSAAHTVNLDDTPTVDKFIAVGASSGNKLTIQSSGALAFSLPSGSSSYGQFVHMNNVFPVSSGAATAYIGSNSTQGGDQPGGSWLLQDPPKISTLVDPLTTAPSSNSNWSVASYSGAALPSLVTTGYDGGGYRFDNKDGIISTDTYDIVDNDFIYEVSGFANGSGFYQAGVAVGFLTGALITASMGASGIVTGVYVTRDSNGMGASGEGGGADMGTILSPPYYIKLRYVSSINKIRVSKSTDGNTWTNTVELTPNSKFANELWFRSCRIQVNINDSGAEYTLGSINPTLGFPVSKTQTTKARIAINRTKTQPSIAKIASAHTRTQTTKARISNRFTKAQTVDALIASNLSTAQSAIAFIVTQLIIHQTATARVERTVTKTQTAVGKIAYLVSKDQSAIGRISHTFSATQDAQAYIILNRIHTQSAKAALIGIATKTQSAKARISQPFSQTQSVIARVARNYSKLQNAQATIGQTITKTQSAVGRINQQFTKTQSALARVRRVVTAEQTATAFVLVGKPIEKSYLIKVYSGGQFLGLLPQPTNSIVINQDINTVGSNITLQIPVSADTSSESSVSAILTENDELILTEDERSILTEGAVNLLGIGVSTNTLIKNGNKVKIWEYSRYHVNGKIIFSGEIDRWEAAFGMAQEGITIVAYSDGQDMDNYLVLGSPYISDVTQSSQNDSITINNQPGGSSSYRQIGQTWEVGSGVGNLGAIALRLNGAADVTIRIYDSVPTTTASGSPIASTTVQVDTGGSPQEVQIAFASPVPVEDEETYFMAISVASGQNISIYFQGSNVYADGAMYVASYTGGGSAPSWVQTPVGVIVASSDIYFKTYRNAGETTAVFPSQDPTADTGLEIMQSYREQGGIVKFDETTIEPTGLSIPYTFNTQTIREAIQTIKSLAPSDFYYYIDLGTSTLYIKETSTTPDFVVTKGRHIQSLNVVATIENIANTLFFSGGDAGGGLNLYKRYSDQDSIGYYGQRLGRRSDARVTVNDTANAFGASFIAENKDEQFQTSVTIHDESTDITQFQPGMTIGFNGFGTFIDSLVLQVVRRTYTPEAVTLLLGILPPRLNPLIEQATRDILTLQTIDNPAGPS